MAILFSGQTFYKIKVEGITENIQHFELIIKFDQWSRRIIMSFKDFFLFLALATILISRQNLLCHFGRGHYANNRSEIILNFDQICSRRVVDKRKVYKRHHYGQSPINIAHLEPSKNNKFFMNFFFYFSE